MRTRGLWQSPRQNLFKIGVHEGLEREKLNGEGEDSCSPDSRAPSSYVDGINAHCHLHTKSYRKTSYYMSEWVPPPIDQNLPLHLSFVLHPLTQRTTNKTQRWSKSRLAERRLQSPRRPSSSKTTITSLLTQSTRPSSLILRRGAIPLPSVLSSISPFHPSDVQHCLSMERVRPVDLSTI